MNETRHSVLVCDPSSSGAGEKFCGRPMPWLFECDLRLASVETESRGTVFETCRPQKRIFKFTECLGARGGIQLAFFSD